MFRPNKAGQMTTPIILQKPTSSKAGGVVVKSYADAGAPFMCNLSVYGAESESNGVVAAEETATITTWYNPEITAECRIKRLPDNATFEVLGTPENVENRNMFCVFKVRRVRGGA